MTENWATEDLPALKDEISTVYMFLACTSRDIIKALAVNTPGNMCTNTLTYTAPL
jgi:hypothetical protein